MEAYSFSEKLKFGTYVMHGVVDALKKLTKVNIRTQNLPEQDNELIGGIILVSSLLLLGIDQACDNRHNIQTIAQCDTRRNNYSQRRTLRRTADEQLNIDIRNSFAHGDWAIGSIDENGGKTQVVALNINNSQDGPIIIRLKDLKAYINSIITSNNNRTDQEDRIDRCQLSKDMIHISDFYLNNREFAFETEEEKQRFERELRDPDQLETLLLLPALAMLTTFTQDEFRNAGIYNFDDWVYKKESFDIIRNSFAHGSFYKHSDDEICFEDNHQIRSGASRSRTIILTRNGITKFLDKVKDLAIAHISTLPVDI